MNKNLENIAMKLNKLFIRLNDLACTNLAELCTKIYKSSSICEARFVL